MFSETYVPAVNGIATHVNLLKRGLEKLGHEVLVVCAMSTAKKHFLKDGVLYCPAVDLKKLCQTSFVAGPISPSRFKFVKIFNPDLIHIHTEFGIGYSGMSIAKFLRIPLVYTLHTMYYDYLYYIFKDKWKNFGKKALKFYTKVLAQKATCLVGPSKKVEKFFHSECGVEKPVHVINNPVEVDLFNYSKFSRSEILNLRARLGVLPSEILACFCSRLGKEKSIDVLLKFWSLSVKNSNKYKLLILGDGPCKEELKKLSRELNLQDQVIFCGEISHDKLAVFYAICDFYVTTSLSEVHSMSMLEAMASGLLVFHLYDELNANQIRTGVNGYFFKNAVEMRQLFDDYCKMSNFEKQTLKEQVRSSVMQSGEIAFAKKMIEIYKNALEINTIQNRSLLKFNFHLKNIMKRS